MCIYRKKLEMAKKITYSEYKDALKTVGAYSKQQSVKVVRVGAKKTVVGAKKISSSVLNRLKKMVK
jgi:hypothetical protein